MRKHLEALREEAKSVFQGAYPPFVMGRDRLDHIPVFSFHSVDPSGFEAQLRHLSRNGYRTLKAGEVVNCIQSNRELDRKSVALTFDDGRRSVWAVAYPLLKKYRFTATVFLIPGIVGESRHAGPCWSGRGGSFSEEWRRCDMSLQPVLNWEEIRIMHEQGVIDFQAHTLTHQRIPVSQRIVDFVHPGLIQSHLFQFTIPYMKGIDPLKDAEAILGAPVYENAPAMGGRPMYSENEEVRRRCVETVRLEGHAFFNRPDWRRLLRKRAAEAASSAQSDSVFENPESRMKRMIRQLRQCREIIEERIPDHRVIHLAYPWGAGSETSIQASAAAGFISNFWATRPYHAVNRTGDDPFRLVRLKHDFILRLPGEGRRSFPALWAGKLIRRVTGNIDY
ncbi:MAG TPA: hypothetical protein ENN03_10045 [bacterium]|nr:hypothetical protein [bacterium]